MLPDSLREPLMRAATIIAVLATVAVMLIDPFMALLVSFGVGLTPDQTGAIANLLQAVITALGVLGVGVAVHGKVTPVKAPVLPAGATVTVQGTEDTVRIEPTPPGPVGRDAGAASG